MRKRIQLITGLLCCALLLATSTANAHPGRTDSNGGHTCRTNCEKWGYEYGEYHYHNDGNSGSDNSSNNSNSNDNDTSSSSNNSGEDSSSSKSSSERDTQKSVPATPPSEPEPKVDKKQVEADQNYKAALDSYNSANYEDAINNLEKIHELKKDDKNTDELVQKSVEAIYELAETALREEDYDTVKEHLAYIQDYKRASDDIKKKAKNLLEQSELNESISKLLAKARNSMEKENYENAIKELEQIYELKETDAETDKLVQKSVEAIYKLAETAFDKEDYQSAKEHLAYIQDYERATEDIKKKTKKLQEKIEINEQVNKLLANAKNHLDEDEFKEALKSVQDAQELSDEKEVNVLYKETLKALTNYAETAYQNKQYEKAIPAYKLLIKNVASKKLEEQYQSVLHQLQDEQLIQESFGIDTDDLAQDSLFNHLMDKENETPYNKSVEESLKSILADKTDEKFNYIFSIQLDELIKGGQDDAS